MDSGLDGGGFRSLLEDRAVVVHYSVSYVVATLHFPFHVSLVYVSVSCCP
jgi:hypothetical protein